MYSKTLAIVAFAAALGFVEPHGWLKSPIARTSIQNAPQFNTQQPYWWDNSGVWCANIQQTTSFSSCGRCGEAQGNGDASQGGMYDKGVIVANYSAGATISIQAEMTAAHAGQFEIDLCPQQTESDNCFQRLNVVSASNGVRNGRACVVQGTVTAQVQLPAGVRCSRCTLRWTYRTNYPWYEGYEECNQDPRPAQTFRNCADIAIN